MLVVHEGKLLHGANRSNWGSVGGRLWNGDEALNLIALHGWLRRGDNGLRTVALYAFLNHGCDVIRATGGRSFRQRRRVLMLVVPDDGRGQGSSGLRADVHD